MKKNNIKLKTKGKKATIKEIEFETSKILNKYINKPFNDIKDEIEEDLKSYFKGIINYTYHGYETKHGLVQDIQIYFKEKGK